MPQAATESFAPELRGLAARFAERLGDRRAAESTLALVRERAPDDRLALAFLLKLAEQSPATLAAALRDPQRAADLVFCLGASELVASDLSALDARWLAFFDQARTNSTEELIESIRLEPPVGAERRDAARILGEFKRQAFLRIAIGDLVGRLGVVGTMAAMSRLADECIRGALEAAAGLVASQTGPAADFCVIAMGKLGAGELNLSSDIDLMYLCDQMGEESARRVGEKVTELLSQGCFRTDLRLRPGGRNSPLVVSFDNALNFYESLGQTWERAALLRARPVAGAVAAGQRLIGELGRFIYRSYLDFDTLRQLRAMKRQVESELRTPDLVERNVKLGYGGIRELEFIVQALTLIYGGRDPRLRVAQTLDALDRLEAYGYMHRGRAQRLKEAYLFLRDVEHKLQVAAGLQVHTLPNGAEAQAVMATRMGFGKDAAARARFARILKAHRDLVATQFREMLAGGEERSARPVPELARRAWQAAFDPERAATALADLGFMHADESVAHLTLLAHGPRHGLASPRRRELLEYLGPLLLDEIRALADPDLALKNMASFIAAIGARTSFLALLEEHTATRRVLLRLFASSSYLSTVFIRHPDMLDTLVRSDLARLHKSSAELTSDLSGLIAAAEDFESRLDAIRAFRHQEFLRIAIADLAGNLELDEIQVELTALAETVLREALSLAHGEVAARRAIPTGLRLCAIAMGRLGAAEMSYNSDLDLIFVYHVPDEVASGGREAASRIVQRLIGVLEARTREGYAYRLDLRLRPSGNAGPLVASLDGFRDYHRQSSAVWERQALVRARVVAGDSSLAEEVETARREFVYGRGLDAAAVSEIRAMRARMEHEIGAEDRARLNLKQGRGGLVDVEFITQMMALRYAIELPALRVRGTVALIRALGEAGLTAAGDAAHLEADYRFLSRLEDRLRIESDQAAWALPTAREQLTPIARRAGYSGANAAEQLLQELAQRRARIRATFDVCFARESGGPRR
jgi:[glutamine synthetase] adenylyltransferase / [glutamine synthetase]-adenylyl-L-tyrosine phosphorylase